MSVPMTIYIILFGGLLLAEEIALMYGSICLKQYARLFAPVCAAVSVAGGILLTGLGIPAGALVLAIPIIFVGLFLPDNNREIVLHILYEVFWTAAFVIQILFPVVAVEGVEINLIGVFTKVELSSVFAREMLIILGCIAAGIIAGLFLKRNGFFIVETADCMIACAEVQESLGIADTFDILREGLILLAAVMTLILLLTVLCTFRVVYTAHKGARRGRKFRRQSSGAPGKPAAPGVRVRQPGGGNQPSSVPRTQSSLEKPAGVPGRPGASSAVPRTQALSKVRIRCLFGEYAGAALELSPNSALCLGSSPSGNNLVFSGEDISPLHCMILRAERPGNVTIIDSSENGTFLAEGMRLPKEQPFSCRLPCTICFGRTPEVFEITEAEL